MQVCHEQEMEESMAKPLWEPSQARIARSNMARFIRYIEDGIDATVSDYDSLYDFSVRRPEAFWQAVWEFCGIRSSGNWEAVVNDFDRMPGARWFPGVKLNFAQNLLRYRDERLALMYRGEDGRVVDLSYAELHQQVGALAAALRDCGVGVGDRVAGFLPNIPETIIAMLATSSIGAIWSSCSPDFGVAGVLDRFGQIEPKVLFCADGYAYGGKRFDSLQRVADISKQLPGIEKIVVIPHLDANADISILPGALRLQAFTKGFEGTPLEFAQLPFDHPLYIMFSSGTTGIPKCIVHGVGGTLIQHLKELVLHTDLKREDRIFFYTTCGWMMWNWLVSSLAVGSTVVLYDGSPFYPDGKHLWTLADDVGITVFGTSAKWISAIEKADVRPIETHKLTALRTVLSTGSPLLPESFDYVYRDIKEDLCLSSISGGTDIVSCFALGNPILPVWRGELQCRGLGMKVEILNDDGIPVRGEAGELACLQPFPCMPTGFWNDPDGSRYHDAYFSRIENVWCHGDHAILTEHDGVIIQGRSDATLNPGGVRIGTAEIYRQVEKLPEVLESIAIGQDWKDDVRVVLFVRLREGFTLDAALTDRIRSTIRANTTPRHVPAKVLQVDDIPRTISGKIVELAVRNIVHGKPVKNVDALANPAALKQFEGRSELLQD